MPDAIALNDLNGRTLLSTQFDAARQSHDLNLGELPDGVYLLQVSAGDQVL